MDLRQTQNYSHYMQAIGWKVEKLSKNYIYLKKIPLLGCIAKLQRPQKAVDLALLDRWAKDNHTATLYLEPEFESRILNYELWRFKKAKNSFLPSKTIQINLTLSLKEIFNQFRKNARYQIRYAQKAGAIVNQSGNIKTFADMWQKSATQRGMWLSLKKEILSLWKTFTPNANILFAYQKMENPVAGVLLARSPASAHYIYAFSTKEGNRLSAPSLLVWEAIRLAKSKGCKVFDFEGIFDERYPQTKSWQGFTYFKKGFGGKEVVFPPALVKYYNPIAKFLRL